MILSLSLTFFFYIIHELWFKLCEGTKKKVKRRKAHEKKKKEKQEARKRFSYVALILDSYETHTNTCSALSSQSALI